ncbi:MAG: FAD-binding oxidoreductase [Neisseria sp.]|uniref:NAD(P)/FAD-dependent oxidoreductase n=1 Tax=Neisseria sp. TaxID=192066 RepID=UPI0026DBDBC2|nr:FAD-binding oxidoreductase [Neisseria sp.]MDO4640163.1 FAD-binding oxidoreductase [Neisseria sp.]
MPQTEPFHHPDSYYTSSIALPPARPSLQASMNVEICIIGGGLAGLGAALPLVEHGREVVMIEAGRIGSGASGRNGGQVISDYACGMIEIEKQVGLPQAQWFWQQSLDAVALVEQRINQFQIDCDWQYGYATAAIRPHHFKELVSWHDRAAKRYGYTHYELWNKTRLQQALASEHYIGALFDPKSGHLNPLKYTLGLADAAVSAGLKIYEDTPCNGIQRLQKGFIVSTPAADIHCKHLIVAVNSRIGEISATALHKVDRKIIPVGSFIIATEPLGQQAKELIRNNMAVCDNCYILDYFRLSADGRLLFGGKDSSFPRSQKHIIRTLRKNMLKVFPQLENARIDYAWGGECDVSANLAPNFGQLPSNIYFMQGFSGHGVALSGIAGLAVAEAILGNPARLQQFEKLLHRDIPGGPWLRKPALAAASAFHQIKDLF